MATAHPIPANPRFHDLTGQRFGRLFVVSYAGRHRSRTSWNCRCDCGAELTVVSNSLVTGNTTACGCQRKATMSRLRTGHGHSKPGRRSSEYQSWAGMIARCTNPRNPAYANYGGRGIAVCDRWRRSFEAFFADMGPKPSPQHSIERKDNNKGYSPENCCWATRREQSRNTRQNRLLTLNGETMCLADWAIKAGLPNRTLMSRVYLLGWPDDRALTTPVRGR